MVTFLIPIDLKTSDHWIRKLQIQRKKQGFTNHYFLIFREVFALPNLGKVLTEEIDACS